MTVLQRTDLTTSQKIQCAAAAVAGQHAHGEDGAGETSRPTVYAVGAAAESVLRSHFEAPLLQGAAVECGSMMPATPSGSARCGRLVVALRVLAPNAIRPIEDLVPLWGEGLVRDDSAGWSRRHASARFNAQASLGGVEAGALDEMSQGEPVLAGVDATRGICSGCRRRRGVGGVEGSVSGAELGDRASEVFPHAEQRIAFMCSTR